jgi:hypothetical protein
MFAEFVVNFDSGVEARIQPSVIDEHPWIRFRVKNPGEDAEVAPEMIPEIFLPHELFLLGDFLKTFTIWMSSRTWVYPENFPSSDERTTGGLGG